MKRSRHFLFAVLLGSLAWVAAIDNSFVLAQRSKTGLSPANQKKYDALIQSARRSQTISALAIQVGAGFLGLGFLWGAYSTYKKGFKITEGKRIEGRGAVIVATAFAAVGICVVVAGILYGFTVYP